MRARRTIVVGLCGVVASFVDGAGCQRTEFPGAQRSDGPVVALVAGTPIHAVDVAAQAHASNVDPRRALEDLVTFELLARAAADSSIGTFDGEIAERIQAAKVERLVEREIEPRIAKDAISDADVRALYERGKDRFVHGRRVQVAVLCVFTGARMRSEPRARAEANARALKAVVDGQPSRATAAFESIAKDPAWIERKVSLTTVWQSETAPFPPALGRAVLSLSKPGDTTDLVGDETGYYIARFLAEEPPANVSLAEAAPGLRDEMFEPWRRQKFVQLTMEMSNGHDIQVYLENFALLSGPDRAP